MLREVASSDYKGDLDDEDGEEEEDEEIKSSLGMREFHVCSGEASPMSTSTNELHEITYQTMLQEEYERQFTQCTQEVNLACPHEYCAMVTVRLSGRIGD